MLEIAPYQPDHLARLRIQHNQAVMHELLAQPDYAQAIAAADLTFTGLRDGVVVGCAGVFPQWPGRGLAWALVGSLNPRDWVQVTRAALHLFETAHARGYWRIETTVDVSFGAGIRWALMLGFKTEGLMRRYTPQGRDHLMMARFG